MSGGMFRKVAKGELAAFELSARRPGRVRTMSRGPFGRLAPLGAMLLVGLWVVSGCARSQRSGESAGSSAEPFLIPGTFSEATTVADLSARFGAENVVTIRETDDDGGTHSSVVLFPDDPARRAYLRFHDDEALVGLAAFEVRDRESHWRGKLGVRIGMSFAELRAINGRPFGFSGFDRDGRGWAQDAWSLALDDDDGALGALDVAEDEQMYFGVELALRDGRAGTPPEAYPQDDYSASSDDPRFPRLGEIVEVVGFNATTSLDDEW